MAAADSIASQTRSCCVLFEQLREAWKSSRFECKDQLPLSTLHSQSSRFDLWARNIAALHAADLPSSLEHRIRDDKGARDMVRKALTYVEESLEITLSIISGDHPNETWVTEPNSTAESLPSQQTSELIELSLAIDDGIANLFQLSMIIRKKPEMDEYIKATQQFPMDTKTDEIRVSDKFPATRGHDEWLIARLGEAITRRRQYLLARKYHQERMEQVHEMKTGADGKTIWSGEKASTYRRNESLQEYNFQDSQGLTKGSHTEYADSSVGREGNAEILRIPLLPKREDGIRIEYGEYFECPYCKRMQSFKQRSDWKKHVFTDLRPYVCTFEDCGLNMFESQHQWFNHELLFHRKQWACLLCAECPTTSRFGLECHYRNNHEETLGNIESFLNKSRLERIDASCCPLCTEYGAKYQRINQSSKCDVSIQQFQKHLGDHMEQLALTALPPVDTGDDEQGDDQEDERQEDEKQVDEGQDDEGQDGDRREIKKRVTMNQPTLREILSNTAPPPWTLSAFMAYLSQYHCLENLEFIMDAERYLKYYHEFMLRGPSIRLNSQTVDGKYVIKLWEKLLETYIAPSGPREVKLLTGVRDYLMSLPYKEIPPDPVVLDPAVKFIFELMVESVLVPFVNSVEPRGLSNERTEGES